MNKDFTFNTFNKFSNNQFIIITLMAFMSISNMETVKN